MRFRTLVARGLRFHWRAHLGVVLGAAVATAVLVGALVVGDSVRYSLRTTALTRVGETKVALVATDHLFRDRLALDLEPLLHPKTHKANGFRRTAAALQVRGTAASDDGSARINDIQVLGVDDCFWFLGPWRLLGHEGSQSVSIRFWGADNGKTRLPDSEQHQVDINEATAKRLGLSAGDTILVRIEKAAAIPLEAPFAQNESMSIAVRATVQNVVPDWQYGRFSLQANQAAPCNVFFPLKWLQELLGHRGQANMLLAGDFLFERLTADANEALRETWQLADAELELRQLPDQRGVELRSGRVFLGSPVNEAAAKAGGAATGILTYFVNELRAGDRATPYSMVAAVGPLARGGEPPAERFNAEGAENRGDRRENPDSEKDTKDSVRSSPTTAHAPGSLSGEPQAAGAAPLSGVLPQDMADDEIVINAWLAEDLGAKAGDALDLTYFVMGPQNRLETRSSRFRVRAVAPLEGAAADPTLMPDFPGLSEVDNCRDWKPSVPIDLKRIRPKDEDYWKHHRGTPKAFVTLAAGQRMWGNRFGNLTAVRWPGSGSPDALAAKVRKNLDPRSLGLYFQDVRGPALAAAGQGTDFGQLFLGLSLFLVAAAVVLAGLLFSLGVEQRAEETGTLLAVGLPKRRVRRLYLAEGGAIALVAGAAGALAGLAYTKAMLLGLATVWRGAVGSSNLLFHADPLSVAGGAAAGVAVALAAIWLAVRRQARAPARELLAAGADAELRVALPPRVRTWLGAAIAVVGIAGAAAIMILTPAAAGGEAVAGAFFGAGALLLVGGIGACHAVLSALARGPSRPQLSFAGLAVRNAARRRGRSLATITLLACGVFMVIAVGANRMGAPADADRPASGTGGFALWAESSIPVAQDFTSAAGRKAFALPADFATLVKVVPLRVHAGDDASCLNLNRAQTPRLVAVRPEELASRGAFTFAETAAHPAGENPWMVLSRRQSDGAVPAVADQTTITWALGKSVGDTLAYTDEAGRTFQVRLVGALAGSVLQGSLVISEDTFLDKFPSEGGYRMFLIDAPPAAAAKVSRVLTQKMSDVGMEVTPAAARLAAFNAVENTYLAIFQALGGLALVLGSVGLGVVVLRNVMERRGELALLRAVGFPARSLDRLVLAEHWLLLALGLACGVAAALVAVAPAIRSAGTEVPYASLAAMVAAVLASGVLWTYLAARLALRGPLLAALRNE